MKKPLFTLSIVLLALVAQAQTAIKVHDNGQVSFQSATTSYGIQIPTSGVASFEPNVVLAYGPTSVAKARSLLTKAWDVKLVDIALPSSSSFYVLGNGNVFAYGSYLSYSPPDNESKASDPIEGALEKVLSMKGYYLDNHEFDGITPEDFENNENILPEALDGLLKDLDKEKVIGMNAEELEEVLPEAVRHDPEGRMAINYNAVVAVLVEAVKEQQARIDQLETILRENRLLEGKKKTINHMAMKEFLYLCCMILLSTNVMAQYFDNNWALVFNDDFHDFQGWNDYFKEIDRYPGYQRAWECFTRESLTGITTAGRRQAYQTSYAYLGVDNKMTLKSQHISDTPLTCGVDYFVPIGKECPDGIHHNFDSVYFFSGMLETRFLYWFGYYEIKCKMPVHAGAKTSFWLYSQDTNYYEEIDIFENTEEFFPNQPDRGYSCGIHYNPNSSDYYAANHSIGLKYQFPEGVPNVTQEHTYACEWWPDRVRWFFDGEVIFECNDRAEIPQHPMRLKVTHPVLASAVVEGVPIWQESDSVTINYIKYYQLIFDCDTNVAIRNANDITGYQPGVKHSIAMGASGGLAVPDTSDIVYRASESITIDNEFTIPIGAKVAMIIQGCPNSE